MTAPVPGERREVVLRDYPVRLGARQSEHLDEGLREFQLLALADPSVTRDVPGRLMELVEMLYTRYAGDLEGPLATREAALARGDATVDVRYPVPEGAADIVRAWQVVMAEVDEFCRSGDLLSLARPPEVRQLHEWSTEEFLRQLAGEPPRPWTGPLD